MKQILENWREYLLTEAMMTLDTMPPGYYIEIGPNKDAFGRRDNTVYALRLVEDDHMEVIGSANVDRANIFGFGNKQIDPKDTDEFFGAGCDPRYFEKLYTIHLDFPEGEGYGPLFLDLAIELATRDRTMLIPAVLAKGPGSTVAGARKLYKYAYFKRDDITKQDISEHCAKLMWGVQVEPQLEMFPVVPPAFDSASGQMNEKNTLPRELLALYTKEPTILNSPTAKTKIVWETRG